MIVAAPVPWPGLGVGCFDPAMVLHRLEEVFGDALEFDRNDLLEGHYESVVQAAIGLGIPLDRPAVRSAARKIPGTEPPLSVPLAGRSGVVRLGHRRSLFDRGPVRQRGRVSRAGSGPVHPVLAVPEAGRGPSPRG